jgi:hypothetical protein
MSDDRLSRRHLLGGATLLPVTRAQAAPAVRLVDDANRQLSFVVAGKQLFAYQYDRARPKTYVHPLCAPDGTPLTLDSPPDHVHHRALMLGWTDVNGFDFWGEDTPGPHGRMVHHKFARKREKLPAEILTLQHWVAKETVLVIERRALRLVEATAETVWIEWESELAAASDQVRISAGTSVYNGLGIRYVRSMDLGSVLNANGTRSIEKANGEAAPWCTYTGRIATGTAGVAIFDHPRNLRYPTRFFVMNKPFGYMSAAPTWTDPLELRPGQPLRLRYAIVSYLGEPDRGRLENMHNRWSGAASPPSG